MLKQFERELLDESWRHVREGVEVKLCESPEGDEETFILCHSRDRLEREQAIFARFETRIEEGLKKIQASCKKRNSRQSRSRNVWGVWKVPIHALLVCST